MIYNRVLALVFWQISLVIIPILASSSNNMESSNNGVSTAKSSRWFFGLTTPECPEYARHNCNQICQPNDYELQCENYPETPPVCLCYCPSLPPIYNFCNFRRPSSYCTFFCGSGGVGYDCIGPSGHRQCACLCPGFKAAPAAFTSGDSDTEEKQQQQESVAEAKNVTAINSTKD